MEMIRSNPGHGVPRIKDASRNESELTAEASLRYLWAAKVPEILKPSTSERG